MKIRICNLAILVGVLGANPLLGSEDSLPPLEAGKILTTMDELWRNYDPSTEPLETEIVREWKDGDITIRHVVFTMDTFKGQKSRLAAFYAFQKSDQKNSARDEMCLFNSETCAGRVEWSGWM